jgi:hypothetical protein
VFHHDAGPRLATAEATLYGLLDHDDAEYWTGPPERDDHGRARLDRDRDRHGD